MLEQTIILELRFWDEVFYLNTNECSIFHTVFDQLCPIRITFKSFMTANYNQQANGSCNHYIESLKRQIMYYLLLIKKQSFNHFTCLLLTNPKSLPVRTVEMIIILLSCPWKTSALPTLILS